MNKDALKLGAVEYAGSAFLSLLGATLRFRVEGAHHLASLRDEEQPFIFCIWHSRLLPMVHAHRGEGIVALVSEHRDGEYIARVMHRRGFETARGSSTRGGDRGLRELLRKAREGRDLAITPDGPRGPARQLKLGALTLARLTGLPILPLSASGARVWSASSWDRFMVPLPFSIVHVAYGHPVRIPRRIDDDELESLRVQVEDTMNRLTDDVDLRATGSLEADAGRPLDSDPRDPT
jgi:lysophospholipid acyltransferase (LPLAT)-like uncharacterized protein